MPGRCMAANSTRAPTTENQSADTPQSPLILVMEFTRLTLLSQ
jgi:hypothetical protein